MKNKCNKSYMPKFQEIAINSDGSIESMEKLITDSGFGLPSEVIEDDATEWVTVFDKDDNPFSELQIVPRHYYGFQLSAGKTYVRITFTYADALAEEIILLKELKLI